MTKSVEHVIVVQPSLHAMLLHSFEPDHQPKYELQTHTHTQKKMQTKLTFPYDLSLFFAWLSTILFKPTILSKSPSAQVVGALAER